MEKMSIIEYFPVVTNVFIAVIAKSLTRSRLNNFSDHGSRNPSEVGEDVKGNLIEIVNETEMKEVPIGEAIPDEPIQESPKTNSKITFFAIQALC